MGKCFRAALSAIHAGTQAEALLRSASDDNIEHVRDFAAMLEDIDGELHIFRRSFVAPGWTAARSV